VTQSSQINLEKGKQSRKIHSSPFPNLKLCDKNVEEGDGRCVRASLLGSIELSKFNLLLNPPYPLQFHKSFR
jgi:hypothetical protein